MTKVPTVPHVHRGQAKVTCSVYGHVHTFSIQTGSVYSPSRAIADMPISDARRHVNKMCMAANVPLVESGTAGYLGQVQPILKVRYNLKNSYGTEPSASSHIDGFFN